MIKSSVKKIIKKTMQINSKNQHSLDFSKYQKRIRRNDVTVIRLNNKNTFFRIDLNLNLPQIKQASHQAMVRILQNKRIAYWEIPNLSSGPSVICIHESDSERVLSALTSAVELSHWYLDNVGPNGRRIGVSRLLPAVNPRREYSGCRIFERVSASANTDFSSNADQGVEFHFWRDADEVTGAIESKVWNERCTLLPAPDIAGNEFASIVTKSFAPNLDDVTFPIDAVYTWVDGADESWAQQKIAVLESLSGESFVQDAAADARFHDHDELRYSLRSIDQYAPWINKIWIVTNGQVPKWLDVDNPRVQIVSHDEIWPDGVGLPNFNSHAIESCLHRIPGLAERFLYFNDDFFFGRPVSPNLFFHGEFLSKFFYSKALVDHLPSSEEDNASTVAAKNARQVISESENKSFSRKFFHTPNPINKSVMMAAENENPEIFSQTRAAQFRQPTDIAAAGSFYFNYANSKGFAVPGQIRYDYVDPATKDGKQRFSSLVKRHNLDCFVVNDGSTDESLKQRINTDRYIRRMLEQFIPVPSCFEKKL